jgi:transaldolase
LAYLKFTEVFGGDEFKQLQVLGCQYQRPLWASTSTKNKNYPDTLYVDELIGPNTVNTVPPDTLDAFRDHGIARLTIDQGLEEAHQLILDLENEDIFMDTVTKELEEEGVKAFSNAFTELLETIELRRRQAIPN